MIKTFANITSFLFHPLLIPSYLLLILFNTNTHYLILPFEIKRLIFVLIFLCSFLIPLAITPFLIHLKIVSNMRMVKHSERVIPLIIGALSYFFAVYILNQFHSQAFEFITIFMLSSGILILLCSIISIKWKISAHLIALGGLMSSVYYYGIHYVSDFTNILSLISIIAGITAFSRLKLQEHTPAQVYSGFLMGFFGIILLFIIIL